MTGSSKTLSAAPQKWSQTTGWASGFSNFRVCFSLGLNPSNPGHNPPNTCKGASFNLPWGISTGRAATDSQHHGGLLGLGGNLWQGSEVSRKVIQRGGWSTSCRAISTAPHADTGTATQEGWGTNSTTRLCWRLQGVSRRLGGLQLPKWTALLLTSQVRYKGKGLLLALSRYCRSLTPGRGSFEQCKPFCSNDLSKLF